MPGGDVIEDRTDLADSAQDPLGNLLVNQFALPIGITDVDLTFGMAAVATRIRDEITEPLG